MPKGHELCGQFHQFHKLTLSHRNQAFVKIKIKLWQSILQRNQYELFPTEPLYKQSDKETYNKQKREKIPWFSEVLFQCCRRQVNFFAKGLMSRWKKQ